MKNQKTKAYKTNDVAQQWYVVSASALPLGRLAGVAVGAAAMNPRREPSPYGIASGCAILFLPQSLSRNP